METIKIEGNVLEMVIAAMENSEMFGSHGSDMLRQIAARAELIKYLPGELVIREGEPSESFFLIINGEVAVLSKQHSDEEVLELCHMTPPAIIGDIGLLLEHTRTATISAVEESLLLKFDRPIFDYMFENTPAFRHSITKFLANRVYQLSGLVSLPEVKEEVVEPEHELIKLLPMEFSVRHRILPLEIKDDILFLGAVDNPTPAVVEMLHRYLPGQKLRLRKLTILHFNNIMQSRAGVEELYPDDKPEPPEVVDETKEIPSKSPRLDALLKRLVEEGASDLHLNAGRSPYWRIDGDMRPISDIKPMGSEEVFKLLEPIMSEHILKEFKEKMDVDFAYTLRGSARFRVNLYSEYHGISAAFRVIPSTILSIDQLGLPPAIKEICRAPKGLVLVTGASGSGKTSTLASLLHYINLNRKTHIITIEDPIEFVHESDQSLVTQREIGTNASGFARGLRAALREDPDIVLVGEMRDLETMSLALKMADTGHLVFATLHTATAVGTINRIIDMFPPEEQTQVRSTLADSLKCVISQVLCKRTGGGRMAAFEVLIVDKPMANMIREEKTVQIPSMMQTSRAQGNSFLNENLCRLINERKVVAMDAISKAIDKADLEKRLGPLGVPTACKKW